MSQALVPYNPEKGRRELHPDGHAYGVAPVRPEQVQPTNLLTKGIRVAQHMLALMNGSHEVERLRQQRAEAAVADAWQRMDSTTIGLEAQHERFMNGARGIANMHARDQAAATTHEDRVRSEATSKGRLSNHIRTSWKEPSRALREISVAAQTIVDSTSTVDTIDHASQVRAVVRASNTTPVYDGLTQELVTTLGSMFDTLPAGSTARVVAARAAYAPVVFAAAVTELDKSRNDSARASEFADRLDGCLAVLGVSDAEAAAVADAVTDAIMPAFVERAQQSGA